jgi:hypothetical protein
LSVGKPGRFVVASSPLALTASRISGKSRLGTIRNGVRATRNTARWARYPTWVSVAGIAS